MPRSRPGFSRWVIAATLALAPTLSGLAAAQTEKPSGLAIALIGATSRTAQALIPLALDRGHDVIAVARRPEEIAVKHPRLRALKGDVYDVASIEAALTGREVVISMVGPKASVTPSKDTEVPVADLVSQGTANIIQAMKAKGNRRLIVASSSLAEIVPHDGPPPANAPPYVQYLWTMRSLYQDDRDMEAVVRVSGLEAVILRPGFLTQDPARNDIKLVVSPQGRSMTPKRTQVTYADFAAFTLEQATSAKFVGQTVGIYSTVCPAKTHFTDWGCVND